MKIAVLADIHANLAAFEAVLKHMGYADRVWCLGDLVGYGAKPNDVLSLAKRLNVESVMGNHDQAAITGLPLDFNPYAAKAIIQTHRMLTAQSLSFLKNLPLSLRFTIGGMVFLLVHGSPTDPLNEYVFPENARYVFKDLLRKAEADVLLLGHTHVPMCLQEKDGFIINPGAVGQPRDRDPRASYVVLDIQDGGLTVNSRRVEYDIAKAAEEIVQAGFPPYLAQRLYYGS